MSVLIVAEHDNAELKPATLNTVTAAGQLGGEMHVLVAGHNCAPVAEAAAKVAGVTKVLLADAAEYEHRVAENVAPLIASLAEGYGHLLAPATTSGKNIMPRVAALLDVQQISDISGVESEDTFVRPIYAGNALATVRSKDSIKVITVRATAFDAAAEGGSAPVEAVSATGDAGLASFAGQDLTESERPEPTSPCSTASRTSWARPSAPAARRSTPASCRTTTRSARPARWSLRTSTSPSASRARSSTWPA
jgi:electron transfer flavoprotein alpha subunit